MIPSRYLTSDDLHTLRPVHAVWELTLACDLRCRHCGSRAGKRRPRELTNAEALSLVGQLRDLGTREVTLIGGEAYLRKDWLAIIAAIRRAGMLCTLQSGARNLTANRLRAAADAGLGAVGISLDGLAELHDWLRGVPGSFAAALAALQAAREVKLGTSVNTQLGPQVLAQLDTLMEVICTAGARHWQLQLTVPMGRAADDPELLLQPYQLLELMPKLNELYWRAGTRGLTLQPGNNIGFFGPYESVLRGTGDDRTHFLGCHAGRHAIGIEADGTIKGCPSLPTQGYAGGRVTERSLREIWYESAELAFTRERGLSELWGYCARCYYAPVCEGGCSWMAHSLLQRRGNNPYCHHRALEYEKQGLRERVVPKERAPGRPFDHGRFEVVAERIEDGMEITNAEDVVAGHAAQLKYSHAPQPVLELCRDCRRHVYPGTRACPFCTASVPEAASRYTRTMQHARRSERRLRKLLKVLPPEPTTQPDHDVTELTQTSSRRVV